MKITFNNNKNSIQVMLSPYNNKIKIGKTFNKWLIYLDFKHLLKIK